VRTGYRIGRLGFSILSCACVHMCGGTVWGENDYIMSNFGFCFIDWFV